MKGSGPIESLVGGERNRSCSRARTGNRSCSRVRTGNDFEVSKGNGPIESFVCGERKQSFSRARTLNELGVETNGHAGRVDWNCAGDVSVGGFRGSRSGSGSGRNDSGCGSSSFRDGTTSNKVIDQGEGINKKLKSQPEKRQGDYIFRGNTLELGRTVEKSMVEGTCTEIITIVNANAEQHSRKESGLAIVAAAKATNGVGNANITEHLRTLQIESLLGQVAGSQRANGVRSENTTERRMNVKATTATEGAGLKAGLIEMGPVDGSVRAEGISSKNAMEQETLSANANENSGEAYHNPNGPSLWKEDVKHTSEDSYENEVGRESTLKGTLEINKGLNILCAESKCYESREGRFCVGNSGGMTYELGRVVNAEDANERSFFVGGTRMKKMLLELRRIIGLKKHFGFEWNYGITRASLREYWNWNMSFGEYWNLNLGECWNHHGQMIVPVKFKWIGQNILCSFPVET